LRRDRAVEISRDASTDSQIFCGHFAPVFLLFVTHLGTLVEGAQASPLDSGDVHKHILAAVIWLDKSKALRRIEPLHCPCSHVYSPFEARRHPKSTMPSTASKTTGRTDRHPLIGGWKLWSRQARGRSGLRPEPKLTALDLLGPGPNGPRSSARSHRIPDQGDGRLPVPRETGTKPFPRCEENRPQRFTSMVSVGLDIGDRK
jgi:hypothetical protein